MLEVESVLKRLQDSAHITLVVAASIRYSKILIDTRILNSNKKLTYTKPKTNTTPTLTDSMNNQKLNEPKTDIQNTIKNHKLSLKNHNQHKCTHLGFSIQTHIFSLDLR